MGGKVRGAVAAVSRQFVAQFDAATRARRWELFREAFPDIGALRVVDLGGSAEFWLHAPVRPAHVDVVAQGVQARRVLPWLDVVAGDPVGHEGKYDLAVCDGLLDASRGVVDERASVAWVVRNAAPRYWVRAGSASGRQLGQWFPDAVFRRERRAGVTVSWIAAKPR
ncbi:hypothetical protein [Yinghuangia soli]|uniref:Uncharacterized protein n=1 Tax=Yinghuangia soli TaxID=2908204 RepID=A0AA41Q3C8_9ACTN|nr:hypothetical protein [Yinghuangia soli]MCF2529986.1 hypothetical protein [Yinghuangia soli]